MATTIILKKNLTAGDVPLNSQLSVGELAVNIPDRKIYTLDGGSVVRRLDGAYVSASAPSNPVEGDLWYDTSTNILKTHNGTSFSSAGYTTLSALEDVNLSSAGNGEFLVYDGAEWINKTWAEADIQQASNLSADARAAISVTDNGGDGSLSYSSATGVITYTGPSATEVRAHFSGGAGISLNSGAIAIDFSEFNTDSLVEGTSNIFFTSERVDDRVAALLQEGTNISTVYDDNAGTFTISVDSTGGLDLSSNDTDDISEGLTNLYYTTARARSAISATDAGGDGSISYNSTTGVITYTGPSAAEVRAHFTGGTGISLSSGTIALDFSEFNTDSLVEGTSNLFYTNERVDDRVSSLIVAGTNITSSYDDNANTLTLSVNNTGGFDLSNNDTDDLSEGASNLYYTNSRARSAISVTDNGGDGSLSYSSATGVITYTGPSATEVRAHFTAGTGVDITNGQVSIGQAVETTSDVTFNDITTTGVIYGPASMVIDPSGHGDNTGSVTIKGDLVVDGTTTSVNSNEVNIGDSIIVLNYDEAGTPSQNAGFTVERGTSTNVSFVWNETDDAWDMGNETLQNVTIDGGTY